MRLVELHEQSVTSGLTGLVYCWESGCLQEHLGEEFDASDRVEVCLAPASMEAGVVPSYPRRFHAVSSDDWVNFDTEDRSVLELKLRL